MISPAEFFSDRDKRRALLLSLFVHLSAVLFLAFLVEVPSVKPQESFIVIDVGQPAQAEVLVEAPAAAAPAPQAASPRVAATDAGVPQPQQATPQSTPEPQAAQTAPEQAAPDQEAAVPGPPPQEAEATPPLETATAPQPSAPAPPPAQTPELPLAQAPAGTPLPEIEPPEIAPQPLAQAVRIPQPEVSAQVPEARVITAAPQATVVAAREVSTPQVRASVAADTNVQQPLAQASVAEGRSLPRTGAEATLQAPVEAEAAATVSVAEARSIATTSQARVAAPAQLAAPQISVAQARNVDTASTATVASARPSPSAPQVSVATARAIPAPSATADVETGAEGGQTAAAVATVNTRTPAGGNDMRPGQTQAEDGAEVTALGAAAAPSGVAAPTGTAASPVPYSGKRERPMAVLLDNANGYPQSGLREASTIFEMPVEGGLTRLMSVYDEVDPAQVGPIRSARTYFVEAAQNMNAVLVHDGGAPGAIAAIERSTIPTFNAYSFGVLFVRADGRTAPYNLYSSGEVLREAVNRLDLGRVRDVNGRVFRPDEKRATATSVSVNYSSVYTSGFRYQSATNLYRWLRQDEPASDASGEAVLADAVLVAHIEAHAIPGDSEGRLYIPLEGGEATLFLRGRAIPGKWSPLGGLSFVTDDGKAVDLTPFKTWVMFVPQYAEVTVR